MRHNFEYKGNYYSVDVYEGKEGQWTWSYQIESGPTCTCRDLPLDNEELALIDAKRKVKWIIDHKK